MASSNKKVPKQENNNMDYHSDNSTAPKATRKRKEKRSDSDSATKGENKKKLAKEDRGQEFPSLPIQRIQEKKKVQLINTRIRHEESSDEENMDLSTRQMLRENRIQSNNNDNNDIDYDSSSDSSINSNSSETSAATASNGKPSNYSYSNALSSNHPQGTTKQCKEDCDVEKFVKKCLTLEEGRNTKKQVTQIKEKVELMYNIQKYCN